MMIYLKKISPFGRNDKKQKIPSAKSKQDLYFMLLKEA